MNAVVALLVVIFVCLWGSAILIAYLKSNPWQVKAGDDETVRRLQDEVEELRRRLMDVEDLVSFDRRLSSPGSDDEPHED